MIVCGLDCSGDDILLGVADDECVLGSWLVPARRRHAELLPGEVLRRLEDLGRTPAEVGGYAIIAGPGSYTGLRVGAATVMGLATLGAVPVAALTSFEFLYRLYHRRDRALGCLIPCRGELYYWCEHTVEGKEATSTEVLTVPEIVDRLRPPIRVVGPRMKALSGEFAGQGTDIEVIEGYPAAAGGLLARWGAEKIRQGQVIDWNGWHPNYGPAPGFRTWSAPKR